MEKVETIRQTIVDDKIVKDIFDDLHENAGIIHLKEIKLNEATESIAKLHRQSTEIKEQLKDIENEKAYMISFNKELKNEKQRQSELAKQIKSDKSYQLINNELKETTNKILQAKMIASHAQIEFDGAKRMQAATMKQADIIAGLSREGN